MPTWSSAPAKSPKLTLGTLAQGFPLWPGRIRLNSSQLATHKHIIGVSGVGKSKLLESIFLQLFRQGVGVSLIDPHADSAESLLAMLLTARYFQDPQAYRRLLYIEFAEDEAFLPFNVLKQSWVSAHTLSANVLQAFHRAWPALGEGAAPQFDNLVLAGTLVLIEDGRYPLPALHRLLTDSRFRDEILQRVSDHDILAFFHDRFERWSKTDAPQMIESTLRRLFLLTFSPVLKYSLGQTENALDFRQCLTTIRTACGDD